MFLFMVKTNTLVVFILALALLVQPAFAQSEGVFKTGKPLPNIEFTDIDGNSFNAQELDAPIVLLYFWATWCPPCITKYPDLLNLIETMGDDMEVIAISIDYKEEPLKAFIEEHDSPDLPIRWVHDSDFQLAYTDFLIRGVPTTFVLGSVPERLMIEKIDGNYDWANTELAERLTALVPNPISED